MYRWEVIGREYVPTSGSLIVASNHASNMDPLLLGIAVPRKVRFMAKEELFKNPILGWFCRTLGAFPVRRGASDRNAIKKAFEILSTGQVLAIFPEGTRSKDGQLQQLAPGAMMIAVKSQTTVVPAAIQGSFKLSISNPFPKIRIVFGKPIVLNQELESKQAMESLASSLSADIAGLLYKEH